MLSVCTLPWRGIYSLDAHCSNLLFLSFLCDAYREAVLKQKQSRWIAFLLRLLSGRILASVQMPTSLLSNHILVSFPRGENFVCESNQNAKTKPVDCLSSVKYLPKWQSITRQRSALLPCCLFWQAMIFRLDFQLFEIRSVLALQSTHSVSFSGNWRVSAQCAPLCKHTLTSPLGGAQTPTSRLGGQRIDIIRASFSHLAPSCFSSATLLLPSCMLICLIWAFTLTLARTLAHSQKSETASLSCTFWTM